MGPYFSVSELSSSVMTFSVFGVVFFNWASLSVGDDSGEDEDENDDDDAQALQPCLGWLGCAVPAGVWAGAPGALPLCGGSLGLPVCGLVGSALFRLFGLCSCVFGSERVWRNGCMGPKGGSMTVLNIRRRRY